ncbi:MAG: ECF transporter S component [Clostridia bacterium]|nr:ECF transporter S component [Clostridia bacterium]
MKNRIYTLKITISALCLALAYTLPFLTGQIQQIGNMLCPMHIPVLLCGFLCGWGWGLGVGAIAPLFRSFTLGMPVLFPSALCMAFELGSYGAVAGLLHKLLPRKKQYIYISLLASMLIGRIVWGLSMLIFMGIKGSGFTFSAFLGGAFVNAFPGIIIQIVLVPIIVMILENPKVLNLNDR